MRIKIVIEEGKQITFTNADERDENLIVLFNECNNAEIAVVILRALEDYFRKG